MSAVTRPRGPLPPRVYWTRRAIVLGLAFVMVFSLAKLLGGGSDGKSGDTATQASGTQTSGSQTPGPQSSSTGTAGAKPKPASGTAGAKPKPTLAQPDGPCDPADIKVSPQIEREPNDGDVRIELALTGKAAACTWTASSTSIAVKITSGDDSVWSSQECPALTSTDVVVRSAVPTLVPFSWNGRRSDDCDASDAWALAGWYHVVAAALGGEPTDKQFELTRPPAERFTVTPKPKPKPTPTGSSTPAA